MAQRTQLVDTLKASLKAHGKTYADVADSLQLSETSIKRLFSDRNFSLQRLDDICKMINMEISDLVQLMNETSAEHVSQLTEEQEREIAKDIALLLVTVCVLNRWTLQEIVDNFHLSETHCIRYLAKLDRLKLIELLPKNRVKLLIAPNFKWRENGPIQQFFLEKLEADFFNSRFNKEDERLIVINGMLADSSNAVFQRKMEHLAKEFDALNSDDAGLPLEERNGVTVVLAMRRWAYGLFDDIRKK